MKVKLIQLVNARDSIIKLSYCDIPIKSAYAIKRLLVDIENEANLHNEFRRSLLIKYCIKDEKGAPIVNNDQISFAEGNQELFNKEYNDLLNSEIDIWFNPIRLEDLGNKIEMKPVELFNLECFIKSDNDEDTSIISEVADIEEVIEKDNVTDMNSKKK